MIGTLGNALEWWSWKAQDRMALSFGADRVTYGEFRNWTDNVAALLVHKGVRTGDRVAIFASNSLSWCAAAWGIIKSGGILVPMNYRYTASELDSVLENCSPCILITDTDRQGRVDALSVPPPIMSMIEVTSRRANPAKPFQQELDSKAPVVVAYTSGSTAQPKGVVFTHETMLAYAFEASLTDPQWAAGKKTLGVAPLYTGAGTITLVQFITLGMSAFLSDHFDPAKALRTLMDEKIDHFGGVPTFFEWIAAVPAFANADLSHIKFASTGGARVSRELLETWLQRGVVLRQLYGLTEGGGSTTTMDREGAIHFPEKCGRGGPFTRHLVVDTDFKPVPPGTPGEIILRGPAMMIGYWNNPKATEEAFVNGWLRTGDIGVTDDQGNITLVDRLKDIIISGGLNISPTDVENVIAQLEGVKEVVVIGTKDSRFGETPLAIIHASAPLEVGSIIAHCNKYLSDYKVPRYIVLEPDPLPRLATGKISKRALREKYKNAADEMPRVR